jgi:signal transduction histidine kinase
MTVVGTLTTEYRWLLPSVLVGEPDAAHVVRRSTRDWLVDTLCFLLGFGFTVLVTVDLTRPRQAVAPQWGETPLWLVWTDFGAGVLLAAALWWRRRWPVGLMLAGMPLVTFTVSGAISSFILLFTVAVYRRFSTTAAVTVLWLGANAVFCALRPEAGSAYWESLAWGTVFTLIIVLWGMVVRSRRQLVVSLRDRAERAENEQQLRVAQARALERTRIAREMHDVLAHRISLLSLHAGALEIRPGAAPEEVAGAAGVIRASAHQALQDLRDVIGVLREDDGVRPPDRPQPTLAEVAALAGESRDAGVKVRLDVRVDETGVPELTGRTAYRIVQEALTNARKHAPGTVVTVTLTGAPSTGLTVDVRNPLPVSPVPGAIPGTGTGLIGLAERATLAGGRLAHGRTPQGEFAVTAWLPWPA